MEIPSDEKELKTAVLPDVFTVDYVKVYRKKVGLLRKNGE
jgi:hypothetical protein